MHHHRSVQANQRRIWLALFILLLAHRWGIAQSPLSDTDGLSIVSWSNAEQVVGKTAVVTGKIVDVGRAGRVNFLNFDARRRDVFKVVVFANNLSKFPDSLKNLYHEQLVAVRGRVTLYKGVPQIEVASPKQIQVVNRLPESRLIIRKPRQLSERIRVATLNVRNLYDDVDDPYSADETTPQKPRKELERLAETITEIDADAIALQEVESRGYLQRFNDVFLSDLGYEVVHFSGNDRRGSSLAILSRIPVGRVVSHRHQRFKNPMGDPTRFSRDLLCVELVHPVGRFEIWVTHLKSKRGGAEETEFQRRAEVQAIRRILGERLAVDAAARVLVMGDFNDTPNSRPIQELIQGELLSSLHDKLPRDAITYNQSPYEAMIDYIFVTPGARDGYVADSYRIVDQTLQQSGSDHNAVVAEFQF